MTRTPAHPTYVVFVRHARPPQMTYRRRILQSPEGQTLAEYAMILSLIVLVVFAALPVFGGFVLRLWNDFMTAFGG